MPAATLGSLLGPECPADLSSLPVTGLTADSRNAGAGSVFVAIRGEKADGMAFAEGVAARGAAAIVTEAAEGPVAIGETPVIRVDNARRTLALAAARIHPRQPRVIAAVTGTSGKTSVAAFLRQIFLTEGHQAASIGTIGVVRPSGATYGGLTTPDPVTFHRQLDELAGEGVTHLAIEASSHGLDQHRLDGVRLTAAGFSNLSRDHLDYHHTVDAYREAKLLLFNRLLPSSGTAVLVSSDEARAFERAAEARGQRVLLVGRRQAGASSGLVLLSEEIDGPGQRLTLDVFGQRVVIRLPLLGRFQVDNALLAAGLAIGCGVAPEKALAALETLEGAPGRLEFVGTRRGAPVIVDYAHKPDALEKVLEATRPFAARRLVVVFGCGGDRDPGKRPMMGEIAARLADRVIVTDDNPRSEDPALIRSAILAAAPGAIEIADRAAAIREAIAGLMPGDLLVIAGKGHETGQIVGSVTLPFSDHEVARAALAPPA